MVAPRPAGVPTIGAVAKDGSLLARLLENPMGSAAVGSSSAAVPTPRVSWPAPQTITAELHTIVREGEAVVMQLDENTRVSIAPEGYAARYENSGDNGREVVFRDNTFYLRTRYQKWHQRLPNEPREPFTVLASFDTAAAAIWELLAPGATIVDGGTTTVDGRPAHKLTLKAAAAARSMPKELLPQHAWRETRTITEAAGELVFDTSTLALLSATLNGRLNFVRDGRTLRMDVALTRRSSPGGGRIDLPDLENVVTTAQRRGEADERDFLLEGIAPPSRKSPKNAAPVVPGSTMPAPLPSPGTPPSPSNGRAAKGTSSDQAESPAARSTEDAAKTTTASDAAVSDKKANADASAESKPKAKAAEKAADRAKPGAASDTSSDNKSEGKPSVKSEKKVNAQSGESSGTKSDKTSDPKSDTKSTVKSAPPTPTGKTAGDGKPANVTGPTTSKSRATVTERKP